MLNGLGCHSFCMWTGKILIRPDLMVSHNPVIFINVFLNYDIGARLLVENPFVEHDNSSNATAGRKKRPGPTLGRFYFYLKYDT